MLITIKGKLGSQCIKTTFNLEILCCTCSQTILVLTSEGIPLYKLGACASSESLLKWATNMMVTCRGLLKVLFLLKSVKCYGTLVPRWASRSFPQNIVSCEKKQRIFI